MIKKTVISFILLLALLVTVTIMVQEFGHASERIPAVDDILERYIEAVGGRQALEKMVTRVCTGKEITDLTSRQQPVYESHYFKAYAKIPMSYYTEEWTDAGIYRRGYDGRAGWIGDKCGVKPDESAGKRRLDWLLNPQNALRIKDYFPNLTLEGTQHVRGRMVHVLKSPELHRPLFFDTATGLLIGFGHNWEIHDYIENNGVLFPHTVRLSRKGGSTVYEFKQVEHNVEIDDSLFVMPVDSD
jgi:hypothetical protein